MVSNGIFAGFSKYNKKVYTDDNNEHWDEVIRSMAADTDSQADRFKSIAAQEEGARSDMDQIADIIHATIFEAVMRPRCGEDGTHFAPLSGLAETIAKEKANRSAEKDTVSRGVAGNIEYIDEWDTSKSPPSASYAPNALSAIMDSKPPHSMRMHCLG